MTNKKSTHISSYIESGIVPRKTAINIFYGLLGAFLFFVFWSVIGHFFFTKNDFQQFTGFLPVPAIKAFNNLVSEKQFWVSVSASLKRLATGITIAFVLGFPTGIFIGYYRKLRIITYLPIQFLRMISPLSWMPIALLIFANFESAICFLVTISTIWPIIINTVSGVLNIDINWIIMAKDQGADDKQIIMKVIIPGIIKSTVTSLRLSLGVAWIVLVPAEFLGVSSGLGYLINDARDIMEYDRLMAIIISIGMLGFILDGSIQLLQNEKLGKYILVNVLTKLNRIKTHFFSLLKLLRLKSQFLVFWFFLDFIYIISFLLFSSYNIAGSSGFFIPHFYGIFVGTMVMFTGVGAGVLWFPFLTTLGFTPSEIVPISLFNQITGMGSGSLKYQHDRMLDKKVVQYFIPYTFLGVLLGFIAGFIIPVQHEKWLYLIFIIVVIIILFYMLKNHKSLLLQNKQDVIDDGELKKSGIIVIISSTFTGLLSIGNSDWLIPYMGSKLKMSNSKAVATGIFIMFTAALFYLFLTLLSVISGIIDIPSKLSILFATCSGVILGGQIGSRLISIEWFKKTQNIAFILMLSLSALHITWEFIIKN